MECNGKMIIQILNLNSNWGKVLFSEIVMKEGFSRKNCKIYYCSLTISNLFVQNF